MTHMQNKLALQDLSPEARVEALKKAGWPETEIGDYLNWLFSPLPSGALSERKEAENDLRMNEVLDRCRLMIQKAAEAPKIEKVTLEPFEKDILHNRFLLGGTTDLDGASFHNPKINKEKQVLFWIRHDFIPSGSRMGLLTGGTGAGKTWGWLAYVNTIANIEWDILGRNILYSDAMYVKAYRIAEAVNATGKEASEQKKILHQLRTKRILIIDELGGEPSGFKGDDFLRFYDDLMDERYKYSRLHTLITSNYTIEDTVVNGVKIPGVKSRYGERFISRFNQIGNSLETNDEDMRQQ